MNALARDIIADIKLGGTVNTEGNKTAEREGDMETLVKMKCTETSNIILGLLREFAAGGGTTVLDPLQDSVGRVVDPPPPPPPDEEERSRPSIHLDHCYVRLAPSPPGSATRRRTAENKNAIATADASVTRVARVQHACRICGLPFSAAVDLREHQRHAHGVVDRPHACDHCPKTFSHKPHRDRHQRLHSAGQRSFGCETCGKAYATAGQLGAHRQTHAGKQFICEVCGRGFHQAGHLTRHAAGHAPLKRFGCSLCGRGFTQAEGLRAHQAAHRGETQLCSVCGRSYRNLRHHMTNKHATELPGGEAEEPRVDNTQ